MFRKKYNGGNGNGTKPTPKQIKTGARGSSIPYQPKAFSTTLTKKSGYSASDRASVMKAAGEAIGAMVPGAATGKKVAAAAKTSTKPKQTVSVPGKTKQHPWMTAMKLRPGHKGQEKFNKKKASNDLYTR